MKRNILFFHQSAELYGSDKVLMNILNGITSRGEFHPIVLVPSVGPLLDELSLNKIEVHVLPLAKISRKSISGEGVVILIKEFLNVFRALKKIVGGREIGLVYSNTLAIVVGAIWAKANRLPHVWHVHEIITKPAIARFVYPRLVNFLSKKVIFISLAAQRWMENECVKIKDKSIVVWNGVVDAKRHEFESTQEIGSEFVRKDGEILIALVGRVNSWKGHHLLIDAAEIILQQGISNFRIFFAGDAPPGKEFLSAILARKIQKSPARSNIVFFNRFLKSETVWRAVDIAVVPSTSPEPFGMVAIEAMAFALPVVAARHGGLAEIVEDEATGLMFRPNDAHDLATQLQRLIASSDERNQMGLNGRARQKKFFSIERQVDDIFSILQSIN